MKTTEFTAICPYTGLRSFSEEESLYFKGRDFQIQQITELLERNKFLMVTGASGEGKSSLIYAGLIPNMRAGFFKAKYTNWVVADFRPERSPLSNMAKALSTALTAPEETVATELRRGFSSLIDLYTNSGLYVDEQDASWAGLDSETQKKRKREAANLVVIIDQFEELFTNPENFSDQRPSQDAQTIVNLALETARIALKRGLPLYIVFTMRSDFIGQCVAFRGLPEYIGFSQFFVPRLKRKDFKQVIEEPAILSGNRISQRLIERLVYDIAEGVDQLPVLQHALSQIWLAADQGREEMDLLHYAMVCGMPADELPDEDTARFRAWMETVPDFKKKFYSETGLHRIIEVHANTLYEGAWSTYHADASRTPLTIRQCKKIVALAFTCLTKIDNSRAVRNRVTLREITAVINEPGISEEMVGQVLDVFREEQNSFIRPYKTEDPSTHRLSPDTVLDITHEALIRNWTKLNEWANKEFEFYSTWLDFRKQLERWKSSGKSRAYLLPLGPLTFFEKWYQECKPNQAWIQRYLDSHDTASAKELLSDTNEFLKRSARGVLVTRTFMKYGSQRVAIFLASAIMIVLSGFYWNNAEQKRSDRVVRRAVSQAQKLLTSSEVSTREKANYLLVQERFKAGTMIPFLQSLPDEKSRISLGIDAYEVMMLMDNHYRGALKASLVGFLLNEFKNFKTEGGESFHLRQLNRMVSRLVYDDYYNPLPENQEKLQALTQASETLVKRFYNEPSLFEPTISAEINLAVQFWLTLSNPEASRVEELIALVTPFEQSGQQAFSTYYSKGTFEDDGNLELDYSGGYHLMATLYAAVGREDMIIQCFEKLKELPDYFTGRLFNNYNNVVGYLYQFGHADKREKLLSWIGNTYSANPAQLVYKNLMNRSGYLSRMYLMNFIRVVRSHQGYLHPNLYLAPRSLVGRMAADYEKAMASMPAAEKHFTLAMHFKRMAMFGHKYNYDRGLPEKRDSLNALLDKAWEHYRQVPADYLAKNATPLIVPYWTDGVRQPKVTNRNLFLYPDYMDGWYSRAYHSDLFFSYLRDKHLLEEHYTDAKDLEYIYFWIAKSREVEPAKEGVTYHNFYPLGEETLESVSDFLLKKGSDALLPLMMLANLKFERGDKEGALAVYRKISKDRIGSAIRFEYIEKTYFLNQLRDLIVHLTVIGMESEADALMTRMDVPAAKGFTQVFRAQALFSHDYDPRAFVYLDSALKLSEKEDFNSINLVLNYRVNLIRVMGTIGGTDMDKISREVYTEIFEVEKFNGTVATIKGVATTGNYYAALSAMPSTLTETQEIVCYYHLIHAASLAQEKLGQGSPWPAMDKYISWMDNYVFFNVF